MKIFINHDKRLRQGWTQAFVRHCENCHRNSSNHRHHIFSNTKHNRKKYGILMDDRRNIQYLCYNCHMQKSLKKFTEKEFCEVMGIEYKTGELK